MDSGRAILDEQDGPRGTAPHRFAKELKTSEQCAEPLRVNARARAARTRNTPPLLRESTTPSCLSRARAHWQA
jgi:hypothetical protein